MPTTLSGIYNDPAFANWAASNVAYPASGRPSGGSANLYFPNPGSTMFPGSSSAPPPTAGGSSPTGGAASLNASIPGFSGLSAQASQRISDLMAGKVPSDVQAAIQQGRAQQAVASGMPGSSRIEGTLQGNATLRDLGLTSLQAGQQGFQDLLSMLGAYSGNVFPSANAALSSQTSLQEAQMQDALARAQLAQQGSQFGQNLGFNYAQLGQQGALANQAQQLQNQQFGQNLGFNYAQLGQQGQYQMGQLGLQNQAQQFQNQQFQQELQQRANQYQQNFGLQEQQLAQQLGISQAQLAYQMAALNSQQQNQAAQNALSLAQLNSQNTYNTRAQDLSQLQALYGLLGQGGGNLTNLNQLLGLLGGGSAAPAGQGGFQLFQYPH